MIDNEYIESRLNQEYQKWVDKFQKKRILATFSLGMLNYGFAETEQDCKFVTVYLPTFEELCTGESPCDNVELFDIRRMYNISKNHESIALELLFSQYMKFTPCYEKIFYNKLIANREVISHYCDKERLLKAYDRMIAARTNGDYFEVARLATSAYLYYKGCPTEECFYIKNSMFKRFLISYKKNPDISILSDYENDIQNMIAEVSDKVNLQADLLVKDGIVALITASLQDSVSYDTFISDLTETEKKAFEIINSLLKNGEGSIVVSKLISTYNISRPVFNSLIEKMKNTHIAEIKNQGMKGTYIRLLDFS